MNSTKYWIALNDVQGVGPAHLREFHQAVKNSGIAMSDLFELKAEELKEEFSFNDKLISAIESGRKILPDVEDSYLQVIDAGIDVVPFFSSYYPARLHEVLGTSIPPLLYVYGNKEILGKKGAAILGDKDVSNRGEFITYHASRELVKHDIPVISGFAGGVGLTAHRAALESGGNTIAFLPYGILKLNLPQGFEQFFDGQRIALVSIFRPGDSADKYHAFNRNRVICSLARAVYVVESPETGGVFEAAKSAANLKVPLYTTEYSKYPDGALGNIKIISELGGIAVRGKKADGLTVPNMDRIIADVKFK